jgi:multiple sugar transport system permease protein
MVNITPVAAAETAVTEVHVPHPPMTRPARRTQRLLIALFLAPTVIGLFLFTVVPIVASILLAFFRWDIISAPEFAGVDNFVDIGADPTVRVAFLNTFAFVVVAVVLQLAIALGLAVLVQSRMPSWLRAFFRSSLFFPLILSAASVSLVMAYLFNQDFGLVNAVLNGIGLPDVPWLTPVWVPPWWWCWCTCGRTSGSPSCCSSVAWRPYPGTCTRRPRSMAPPAGASSGTSRCPCSARPRSWHR